MERVREQGVPSGVTYQVIGEHFGNKVVYPYPGKMSVDNRDSRLHSQTENPHRYTCSKLVHFTENEFAAQIGTLDTDGPFSFKPHQWKTNASETNPLKLSWWAALPPDNWQEGFNKHNYYAWGCLGESPAINGPSLCGPIGFVVTWKDLLAQYAKGRRESPDKPISANAKIEFRNLGTFMYQKEIMYGVSVGMDEDNTDDNRFPVIPPDHETEAFSGSPDSDSFIWKLYSSKRNRDVATWDHLAFGFYSPSNLTIEPQFCSIIGKQADFYRPRSRLNNSNRTEEERSPCEGIKTKLNEKIQRAKDVTNIPRT